MPLVHSYASIIRNLTAHKMKAFSAYLHGLILFLSTLPLYAASGRLEVKYFDVGQADAVFIRCPEDRHHILIDSGDSRYPGSQVAFQRFLTHELQTNGAPLHLVVASHPHADHIAGLPWVFTNFNVELYVDCGFPGDSDLFGDLDVIRRQRVARGQTLYIKGRDNSFEEVEVCPFLKIQLIQPSATASLSHLNDRSVAVRIDYLQTSFLFAGDLEGKAEKVMLNQFTPEQRARLDVDVLKVGHHGSDTSSSEGFIMAVSPKIAVVSCGKKQTGTNTGYKHPRLSTLRAYADWFRLHPPPTNAPQDKLFAYEPSTKKWRQEPRPTGLWATTKDGTITIQSDGSTLSVERATD